MGFNGQMSFIYPTQLCPPQTHLNPPIWHP